MCSTSSPPMRGSKRAPRRISAATSSGSDHVPTASPASAAAPSAVASASAATSTGHPARSAWSCIRNPLAVAPPSARRAPTSSGSASSTSATWCATASSAARTRCARVVPRVSPEISPRASGRHCGEPSPVSAGTKVTPSVDSTLVARRSLSDADSITPRPSRSHCSAAPPTSTAPSAAYCGAPPGGTAAAVVSSPSAEAPASSPRATRTNVPVPYVALASPGVKHPCPKSAACWSPAIPAIGTRAPRSVASPITAEERTTSGSTARSTPNSSSSSSSQAPAARSRSIVRDVRASGRELPHEPGVDRAEGQLTGGQLGAREDPLELRGREVRVGHEARSLPDQQRRQLRAALRGAPVLPDDRGMHRPPRRPLPDDGRLTLVRDSDRGEVVRADARLRQGGRGRLLDAHPDLVGIVLDPPRPRERLPDLAVPAADRPEPVVDDEARRPRRPLVDREDQDARSTLDRLRIARGYSGARRRAWGVRAQPAPCRRTAQSLERGMVSRAELRQNVRIGT